MKRIIFTGDFLYHSYEHMQSTSYWFFALTLPVIKQAIGINIDIGFKLIDDNGEEFSRRTFYELGGLKDVKYNYQAYNTETFNDDQIRYLKRFITKDTIIIGFELYEKLVKFLTKFGCTVIDFAFHSYKLFDDLSFGVATNDKNIYEHLITYQISQEQFYFYANYWKVFMQMQGMVKDKKLDDNSALFIGQTLLDKSVDKDGIYLNVTHFESKIKELSEQYSKVYYIPHPYLGRKRKIIYDFVKKCPYIELLGNCSTYGLLASDKVKKVVAISTSVLYEAKYFGKEIEYLYKPLFNIDVPFEEYSYVSIYEDYFNPKFWADILSPVCDVKKDVKDINYFKGSSNKLRNIANLYWGYAQLDPIKRIPSVKESIKGLYRQYIAPLF